VLKNKWFQALLFGFISTAVQAIVSIVLNVNEHTVLLRPTDITLLSPEWIYNFVYSSSYGFSFFLFGRALGLFKFTNK